jgi:hypothetical protein
MGQNELTPREQMGLSYLREKTEEGFTVSGRDMAQFLYPDSPAWRKRTRARRTGTQNGSLGGTMPMLGAKVLHSLERQGLAYQEKDSAWKAVATDGN